MGMSIIEPIFFFQLLYVLYFHKPSSFYFINSLSSGTNGSFFALETDPSFLLLGFWLTESGYQFCDLSASTSLLSTSKSSDSDFHLAESSMKI